MIMKAYTYIIYIYNVDDNSIVHVHVFQSNSCPTIETFPIYFAQIRRLKYEAKRFIGQY